LGDLPLSDGAQLGDVLLGRARFSATWWSAVARTLAASRSVIVVSS
jgi:hypothetical protein